MLKIGPFGPFKAQIRPQILILWANLALLIGFHLYLHTLLYSYGHLLLCL